MIETAIEQNDIGLWSFTVRNGDQVLHMEVEFRSREATEAARDTWMAESNGAKRVKDGILEETREISYLSDEGLPYGQELIKYRENLETGESWWRYLNKASWQKTVIIP